MRRHPKLSNYTFALLGVVLLCAGAWQWDRARPVEFAMSEQHGTIRWVFPGAIRNLGSQKYLVPRREFEFETKLSYPKVVETGKGFQIILENKLIRTRFADAAELSANSLQREYHEFELQFPGIEIAPTGVNRLGIDDKVRWQVAPIRDPGIYVGYVRPKGGTIAIRGGEYGVKWKNPGHLELTIKVKRSFAFMDKAGSLLLGLLGSVLTFPALLTIWLSIKDRKPKSGD